MSRSRRSQVLAFAAAALTYFLSASPTSAQQSPLLIELGKEIFSDTSLSNPPGLACITCHAPKAGFTSNNPVINAKSGIMPGTTGRFVQRKPPTISYAVFSPAGPPVYSPPLDAFVGGLFWDGRSTGLLDQAHFPLFNPLEMNNVLANGQPNYQLVTNKIKNGEYSKLFKQTFGANVFQLPPQTVVTFVTQALAAYESSPEVSPFTSKYDYYLKGQAKFTASELRGLFIFTGSTSGRPGGPAYYKNAHCAECHGVQSAGSPLPDFFSQYCYANIGVPRNPANPYYAEKAVNPAGTNFVDLGLGDYIYPLYGLPAGNQGPHSNGQGDFLGINGAVKVPTLRNVDKRPSANFTKAYMHNGVFKELSTIVEFYNARNLSVQGKLIDFTQARPYAHLAKGDSPLFPPPELFNPASLNNAEGAPGSQGGQVGNLGLTASERADIVNFLKTLSDGFQP